MDESMNKLGQSKLDSINKYVIQRDSPMFNTSERVTRIGTATPEITGPQNRNLLITFTSQVTHYAGM